MRPAVIIVFLIWLCSSIAVISSIEVGLDQEQSLAEDSHVVTYFKVSKIDIRTKMRLEFLKLFGSVSTCSSRKLLNFQTQSSLMMVWGKLFTILFIP